GVFREQPKRVAVHVDRSGLYVEALAKRRERVIAVQCFRVCAVQGIRHAGSSRRVRVDGRRIPLSVTISACSRSATALHLFTERSRMMAERIAVDRWLNRFFDWYFQANPVSATFIGVHVYDHSLPQPRSKTAEQELDALLDDLNSDR